MWYEQTGFGVVRSIFDDAVEEQDYEIPCSVA